MIFVLLIIAYYFDYFQYPTFFYETPYIHVPYTSAPQLAFTIYKDTVQAVYSAPLAPHFIFCVFVC